MSHGMLEGVPEESGPRRDAASESDGADAFLRARQQLEEPPFRIPPNAPLEPGQEAHLLDLPASDFAWRERFVELLALRARFGNLDFAPEKESASGLHSWIAAQRQLYHAQQLGARHRLRLEAIGFPWRSANSNFAITTRSSFAPDNLPRPQSAPHESFPAPEDPSETPATPPPASATKGAPPSATKRRRYSADINALERRHQRVLELGQALGVGLPTAPSLRTAPASPPELPQISSSCNPPSTQPQRCHHHRSSPSSLGAPNKAYTTPAYTMVSVDDALPTALVDSDEDVLEDDEDFIDAAADEALDDDDDDNWTVSRSRHNARKKRRRKSRFFLTYRPKRLSRDSTDFAPRFLSTKPSAPSTTPSTTRRSQPSHSLQSVTPSPSLPPPAPPAAVTTAPVPPYSVAPLPHHYCPPPSPLLSFTTTTTPSTHSPSLSFDSSHIFQMFIFNTANPVRQPQRLLNPPSSSRWIPPAPFHSFPFQP